MKKITLMSAALSLTFMPLGSWAKETIETTSPKGHQAIKAEVINPTPSNFTIDVHSWSNLGADGDADTFAVYVTSRLPQTCGDFRSLELTYEKPSQYQRVFHLEETPQVLAALDQYGCAVIRNIPPA